MILYVTPVNQTHGVLVIQTCNYSRVKRKVTQHLTNVSVNIPAQITELLSDVETRPSLHYKHTAVRTARMLVFFFFHAVTRIPSQV